jgi:hypothetical protein
VENAPDQDCGRIFTVKSKFAIQFRFEDTNKMQIEALKTDYRVGLEDQRFHIVSRKRLESVLSHVK